MQTLHEAGFVILESLMHIERTEGAEHYRPSFNC